MSQKSKYLVAAIALIAVIAVACFGGAWLVRQVIAHHSAHMH